VRKERRIRGRPKSSFPNGLSTGTELRGHSVLPETFDATLASNYLLAVFDQFDFACFAAL
jgi:hypothetical protein